jgi:hypothetical protein
MKLGSKIQDLKLDFGTPSVYFTIRLLHQRKETACLDGEK